MRTYTLEHFRRSADFYLRFFKGHVYEDREDLLSEMVVIWLEKGRKQYLNVRFCYLQALDRLFPRHTAQRERELAGFDVTRLRKRLTAECQTLYFATLILDTRLERIWKRWTVREAEIMWDYFVEGLTLLELGVKYSLDKSKLSRMLVKLLERVE